MRTPLLLFGFIASLTVFTGCKNKSTVQDKDGFNFDEGSVLRDIDVAKSVIFLFPAPGELLDRFYEADLRFSSELLSDPSKGDSYLSSRDKSLNLGIYITDMAYTAMFERSTEAVDYLEVIRKLSSEINVSTSTFESLIQRAKGNIGNADSLITISNEVFYNMMDFLESSGKENTVAIISCGSYVEAMYLALNSMDAYDESDPIVKQISEMKYPMENLMSHAETASDDPNVQSILNYISELNAIFNELDAESSKAVKSEPGVITLSGGSTPDLTKENFDEMKEKVLSIRAHIVGTN